MGDRSKSKEAGRPEIKGCSPETYPTSSGTFWPHHQKNSQHWASLAPTYMYTCEAVSNVVSSSQPYTHYTRPQYLGPNPIFDCRHGFPPFPYIWQKKNNCIHVSVEILDRSKWITHKAFKRMPYIQYLLSKYCFKTCYSQVTLPQFPIN